VGEFLSALMARTRIAGGTVEAQVRRGEPWREVPDPIAVLRAGTQVDRRDPKPPRPALDAAALCELNGLVRSADYWLECIEWTADRLSEECALPARRSTHRSRRSCGSCSPRWRNWSVRRSRARQAPKHRQP